MRNRDPIRPYRANESAADGSARRRSGGCIASAGGDYSFSATFFFTARFRGAFFGAGSFVGWSDTSLEENTLRPCSSNSITVWCSLTSTRVPLPYVACATRSPLVQDFIYLA